VTGGEGGGGGAVVDSVNGATGVVVLDADDIDDAATTHKFATAAQLTKLDAIDADITTFSVPASTTISAFGATLVDDADASAARTTLGLTIGTNVQAQDAELSAIAGLTSAADRLPYFTGSGTAALATFTTAGRDLVDDADASAQRTTLGLGTIATQASSSVSITGGSITGITDLAVADGGTGASTAAAARTNLGVIKRETYTFEGELEVGTGVRRLYFARAATVVNIGASLDVAGTGSGSIVVDVMKNGTTLFTGATGRPEMAASAFTDLTNTPAVTSISSGDYLTVDIISITGTLPGEGLTVVVEYTDA
jgi:hypothetical protein